MVLILSAPPVSAPVPTDQWESITCVWVGCDGSVWDLVKGTEGAVLQALGTEGMHDPVLTKFSSSSRAIPGKRQRGWRAEAREVFWPLRVYADGSAAWTDTYRRFFASISPDRPGTWRVGFRGQIRELDLTGVYGQGHSFGKHPTMLGWEKFGVELEAAQPFWRGAPIRRGPWSAPSSSDFFNGGAPNFVISEGSAFGTAVIDNPGDVPAWPVWTVENALTDISVGVNSSIIEVPFSVADGERLVIDTDPRNPTALLGSIPDDGDVFEGEDVTADLGLQPFVPIEPGKIRRLHVEGTGSGSIEAVLIPLYFRAL